MKDQMNEKRGKRSSWYDPVTRYWFKWNGKIYRFLSWANYEQCYYGGFPREFTLRLPDDDSRPRGVHAFGMCDGAKEIEASLPINQWTEFITETPQ